MVQQTECLDDKLEDQLDRDYQAAIELLLSRAAATSEHDLAPMKFTGRAAKTETAQQAGKVPQVEPDASAGLRTRVSHQAPQENSQMERKSRAVETNNQLQALRSVAKAVAASSVNAHLQVRRKKVKRELCFTGLLAFLGLLNLAICLLIPWSPTSPARAADIGLAIVCLCLYTVVHCVRVMRNLDKRMLSSPDLSKVGNSGLETPTPAPASR